MKKLFLIFLFHILFSGWYELMGQESDSERIITDRPSFGTTTYVIPSGTLQIETGFQFSTLNFDNLGIANNDWNLELFNFNNTLVRYGLSDRVELRFAQNLNSFRYRSNGETLIKGNTTFSPTSLGAKIELVANDSDLPDISLLANFGGNVFTSQPFSAFFEGAVLLSKTIFRDFGLDFNFGTVWLNELSTVSYQYALSISRNVRDNIGLYLESFGIVPEDTRFEEHNINAGINFLLSSTAQLDFFGGTGFSRFSPNVFLGFGFSKMFR